MVRMSREEKLFLTKLFPLLLLLLLWISFIKTQCYTDHYSNSSNVVRSVSSIFHIAFGYKY